MKKIFPTVFLFLLIFSSAATVSSAQSIQIIPEPVSITPQKGEFTLTRETVILADMTNPDIKNIVTQLKEIIDPSTTFDVPVSNSRASESSNTITFSLARDTTSYGNMEGYHLSVTDNNVTVSAPSASGLFYGMQTLLQLLPPEIYYSDYSFVPVDFVWTLPAVEISDYPRFPYRGMHLDVGRHFFPVEFIKKYIDLLAMQKMNRFHWHLTEDQGWRIEIKQYPKLTEVGAWRDSTLIGRYGSGVYDGKRYGGYYTQQEIRDVVQYAQERYVTIIPEIEMPGHATAAVTSYPELGCMEGKDYHVIGKWGVFEDIFCPSEETFTFLENVLTEVIDLFPGEYIHIGGDEAPKTQWEESKIAQDVIKRESLKDEHELQSYFITRIEKFLNEHDREIIGWDEILEGGLAPNATVMSWRGTEGGIEAAKQHHDVIMTPGSHVYLDHYQAPRESEPLAIGGFTTLEKSYSYEPVPDELTEEEAEYILGAQGNVWTEYIHTGDKVEYMAYPRASALAEVTWSPKSKRDFTSFWKRMQPQFKRFEILDVNAATHYKGQIPLWNK